MYPLVESLAVKEGEILNVSYHQARFENAYNELYSSSPSFLLLDNIQIKLPEEGYHKLRILYNKTSTKAEISPYKMTTIKTLRCVQDEQIDYHLKLTDRQALDELYAHREFCDDILIIKEGKITDTYSGNILFSDGKNWFTPSTPLLEGTQRAKLLAEGKISEKDIRLHDLLRFKQFMVINAMRPFDLDRAANISGIE